MYTDWGIRKLDTIPRRKLNFNFGEESDPRERSIFVEANRLKGSKSNCDFTINIIRSLSSYQSLRLENKSILIRVGK